MNDKYFVPKIEDFKVGFEYEFQGIPEGWHKMVFSVENSLKTMAYNIKEGYIRVAYLTKKQIETEGWKFDSSSKENKVPSKKEDEYISFIRKKKDDAPKGIFTSNELIYFINTHKLVINNGEDSDDYYCYFDGECKDINTFRYIYKLLNI